MDNIEQEKLNLSKEDWDLLIKKLSSIVSKAATLSDRSKLTERKDRLRKAEQIKEKALECLDIIKTKTP